MQNRSKLLRLEIRNLGCIGPEGLTIDLNDIVCLVGKNNAGKSTILRAYELAVGKDSFSIETDRCHWAPEGAPTEVILDVHIPQGIGNVADEWKQRIGDFLVVRSRWQWASPDFKKSRSTWSPQANNWAEDGKAGGADPVFNARLPRPLRIGSLDDANTSSDLLLTLALSPFTTQLKALETEPESPLMQAVDVLSKFVNGLTEGHKQRFQDISSKLSSGFQGVFPKLSVRLAVSMSPPTFKLEELVKKGSSIKISEGKTETTLAQQGTGSRRALFWSMLQVHNEMIRENDARSAASKSLTDELKKLQKKAGSPETAAAIEMLQTKLNAIKEGAPLPDDQDDPAFPGYLLLIDEPENALHPMAARAAQRHLYKLADDPNWQVMLTTHSPFFVNPLVNHTTIIRLERDADDERAAISPRIYWTDDITFPEDDKKWLQALQQMDNDLAEIFFGSYPILVEGDTEHAAFIAAVLEDNHDLKNEVIVVRARGKAILRCLIRVMKHFKINFGIIHDSDPPYRKDGSDNGMWTENEEIHKAILECRSEGIEVRHRISIPDFERFLGGEELGKDKPHEGYKRIAADPETKNRVQALFTGLLSGGAQSPFYNDAMDTETHMATLREVLSHWAKENGETDNIRYKGKPPT